MTPSPPELPKFKGSVRVHDSGLRGFSEIAQKEMGTILYLEGYIGSPIITLVLRGPISITAYCGVPSDMLLAERFSDSYEELNNYVESAHGGLTFSGKHALALVEFAPFMSYHFWGWDYGHAGDATMLRSDLIEMDDPVLAALCSGKKWTLPEVLSEAREVAVELHSYVMGVEELATDSQHRHPGLLPKLGGGR